MVPQIVNAQNDFIPPPAPPVSDGYDQGSDLMSRGAQMILRGLMQELEPAMDDINRGFNSIMPQLDAMRPQLEQMMHLMGDIKYYNAPEVLPNGDVLFRRKADAPPYHPSTKPAPPSSAVDL